MTNDQIGRLAELIAAADLSRAVRNRYRRPLFRAISLGEKYPTIDFLVDLLDRRDTSLGFFFVQVKGTASAGPAEARLPIVVAPDRYKLLAKMPIPTSLVGVDIVTETSYLVSAHRRRSGGISGISKGYCLRDDAVKIGLYQEVLRFWQIKRPQLRQTRFHDV